MCMLACTRNMYIIALYICKFMYGCLSRRFVTTCNRFATSNEPFFFFLACLASYSTAFCLIDKHTKLTEFEQADTS